MRFDGYQAVEDDDSLELRTCGACHSTLARPAPLSPIPYDSLHFAGTPLLALGYEQIGSCRYLVLVGERSDDLSWTDVERLPRFTVTETNWALRLLAVCYAIALAAAADAAEQTEAA